MKEMKSIGLTGGLGSGKSVISKLLKIMDVPVYDSDSEAKKLMNTSSYIKEKLVEKFGTSIYKNGILEKKILASLIFNNQENIQYVNSVVHPEVYRDFLLWQKQYAGKCFVAIESAILFESGFDKESDVIINVSAPLELRVQRAEKRDRINRKQILNRIENQTSEEYRNFKSDYTIINNDIEALIPQVENILKVLSY